ncbi:MAG: sulfatase [Planctomycetia bacterium]|nr:sulfatase [Planctomycetia bacterium]
MSRVVFLLAVGALAAIGYVTLASSRSTRRVHAQSKVPGIVVVCLDTLRADAVDAGPDHDGLPSFRAFAADATRFTCAFAPSSWTAPSVSTILTGLLPGSHGVLDTASSTRLPAAIPTLATLLAERGFSTAACTGGGWVERGSGLERGFEQFASDFDAIAPAEAVARWQARRPLDRPFFLFLHSYAAHDPYGDKSRTGADPCPGGEGEEGRAVAAALAAAGARPDDTLRLRYLELRMTDRCARRRLADGLGTERFGAVYAACRDLVDGAWRDVPDGPATIARIRAAYHRALPYVDRRLAETLRALASLPPETVIVVCSDHGEALGDHGPVQHGRHVSHELTSVALAIRARGLPAGATVGAACGLADVVPTLLDLAGIRTDLTLDGRSLVGAGDGPGRPVPSIVVSPEDGSGDDEPWVRRAAVRDAAVAWLGEFDRRTGTWVAETWYDRAADPTERFPLVAAPPRGQSAEFSRVRAETRRTVELRTR